MNARKNIFKKKPTPQVIFFHKNTPASHINFYIAFNEQVQL